MSESDKKVIILIHGMGEHSEESIATEFKEACNSALNLYQSWQGKKVEDLVTLSSYSYDEVFNEYKSDLADSSERTADAISQLGGQASVISNALQIINQMDEKLSGDSNFNTHWLDVILYRYTMLSEPVRLGLARKIVDAIADVGASNVHIVAHSLGCSVAHDTLEKMYGPNPYANKLNVKTQKLGGLHMIANVSRVLQSFSRVRYSTVNPGAHGCLFRYFEYRHKLDPIPQVKPFNPTNNELWVTHKEFEKYALIEPDSVTQANSHSLSHYIANPAVHTVMFKHLFKFKSLKSERTAAWDAYYSGTVQGKAAALHQLVDNIKFGELDSAEAINQLLRTAVDFKNIAAGFAEEFV